VAASAAASMAAWRSAGGAHGIGIRRWRSGINNDAHMVHAAAARRTCTHSHQLAAAPAANNACLGVSRSLSGVCVMGRRPRFYLSAITMAPGMRRWTGGLRWLQEDYGRPAILSPVLVADYRGRGVMVVTVLR